MTNTEVEAVSAPDDHRFAVDLRGIVDLLSNHLYSSPRVYLRELLQNGVDAVTARSSLPGSTPSGRIVIESPAVTGDGSIRVTDNGIGLTADETHSLLATIGHSSKRDEFSLARADFLGQFGIGLLSCFLVADQIIVRTRSARDADAPTVLWSARSDGSYRVSNAPEPLEHPGTEVTLIPRERNSVWFAAATIRELVTHFGSLLSIEVVLRDTSSTDEPVVESLMSNATPPWEMGQDDARQECRDQFGFTPFDVIQLDVPLAGLKGVAYVLAQSVDPAAKVGHRTYLKRMLLADRLIGLLPDWAFFVRCVVDVTEVRPTASREALYEDELLDATREEVGRQIMEWLRRLAATSPSRMRDFLNIHSLALKALALHDDAMLELADKWLPMETSIGDISIAEYRRTFPIIRFTRTVDEFRAVAGVAAAQGIGLVNGGYTYDSQILQRLRERYNLDIEFLDPAALAGTLTAVEEPIHLGLRELLRTAAQELDHRDIDVVVRMFDPPTIPALYLPDPGVDRRSIVASGRESGGIWAGVLDAIETPDDRRPQFVLNWSNALIRRLSELGDAELNAATTGGLYVHALLQGRQPLRSGDSALVNGAFLTLLERSMHRDPPADATKPEAERS